MHWPFNLRYPSVSFFYFIHFFSMIRFLWYIFNSIFYIERIINCIGLSYKAGWFILYTWPPMCETRYTGEILQIERDTKQPFRPVNVNCTVALNEAWDVPTMRSEQQLVISLFISDTCIRSSCTFPFFFPSPLLSFFLSFLFFFFNIVHDLGKRETNISISFVAIRWHRLTEKW